MKLTIHYGQILNKSETARQMVRRFLQENPDKKAIIVSPDGMKEVRNDSSSKPY